LFELEGAPDERWVTSVPPRRGVVETQVLESKVLDDRREFWIYTPPDYAADQRPHPLVIFANGLGYVASGVAPTTVDNLVAAGKIRPPVMCFIQLPELARADGVAAELLARVRSTHRISSRAEDIVIGGFSAGGVAAAYTALKHSAVFGNVFSQSGSFRARIPGSSEPNLLSALYADAPRLPVRFYVETGLYEPYPAANRPIDEMALEESNTAGNRHFRDVLRAKGYDLTYRETGGGHEALHWRATLAEALTALLRSEQ
jgi:enterochelin esterase family protein